MSGTTISGSYLSGIRLTEGSANPVTVSSTATITAASGSALYLAASVDWTLTNSGTLYGYSQGMLMPGGGSVTNQGGGTIAATGPSANGIQLAGAITSTIHNLGLITGSGRGVFDLIAAYVYNQASGTTVGTIAGLEGVYLGSGTVNNAGVINVTANASSTYSIGVDLQSAGFVTNQSGGVITASHLGIDAPNGTVGNNGTIIAGYYGVSRASLVTNQSSGTIIGGKWGLDLGTATVVNSGSIAGSGTYDNGTAIVTFSDGAGIVMTGGGYVTNTASGTITGMQIGVALSGGTSTIRNAGHIAGGQDAILFGEGSANRLAIDPGATFVGTVDGGNTPGVSGAVSTLELASSSGVGTLSGLGSHYIDFAQIVVDAHANWSLSGSNTIDAGVTLNGPGAITLNAGATLDVAGTVASGESIVFGGNNATLVMETTASMSGAVTGFAPGDTIDLRGVSYSSVSFVNGTLDYMGPAGSASFPLALAQPATVHATNDGANGADVTLCFCAGTRLATPRGEDRVERLAAGDTVLTANGAVRRILWVGAGKVLAARGRRSAATPVIVRKGALADNVPYHDLRITKGHALWLDDVLIPVEFLVNHRSILWDDRAQEVSLYHIELDRHDVLLANGAPAESYRDDGNRWLFANANNGWGQPPLQPCATVLTGGPVVDAVWGRLLERAGPRPGVPMTDDPDLHLLIDGVRIDAAWRDGSMHLFRFVARPDCVRVASRSGVPQEWGLARDPRPLGVALRRVVVRRGAGLAMLEADDPRLTRGFHGFEPELGVRWTDGDAVLPVELFESFSGLIDVELYLGGATRYPADLMALAA
ncbi:MAG TPA: Hint domain-containing protein [Acetobacteraceae bacterium]|nr:Hint domain-containing protein [Acetobacteraceae bacterium]